jgi:hypothetical protein
MVDHITALRGKIEPCYFSLSALPHWNEPPMKFKALGLCSSMGLAALMWVNSRGYVA